jgi:hypothetical protein
MATNLMVIERPEPDWPALIPTIFASDGNRAGIVLAWRPDEYNNYALNKADLDRLLELKRDGSFHAAYVVIATISGEFLRAYIGHRDAEELAKELESARLRKGPHGDYWLLQEGVVPLEITNDDVPF